MVFLYFVEFFGLHAIFCGLVHEHSIHHFRHEIARLYLCFTLLRMIFCMLQNVLFCHFLFGAHVSMTTTMTTRDSFNKISCCTVDGFLFVLFQSMDNIWCHRQENTIDWLLSIEHTFYVSLA